MRVLTLHVGRNRGGDTYEVSLESRKHLKEVPGLLGAAPRVFIAREPGMEGELIEDQKVALVEVLTGLRGEATRTYQVDLRVYTRMDPEVRVLNWLPPRDPSAP